MRLIDEIKEKLQLVEPEEWKWIFQGALIPIAISATLICAGIFWSVLKVGGINWVDHIYNGTVSLRMASVIAMVLGVPSIMFVFPFGKKKAPYWRFAGFFPVFILITAWVWNGDGIDYRIAPEPDRKFKIHLEWPKN